MNALHSFVQDLRTHINGVRSDYDTFSLPTEASEWSIFAHQLPDEPRIWLHLGIRNTTCYALRIGLSSYQNPLLKQWFNGPNAIRHILVNLKTPSTALIHSRANEVDFYRQCQGLFSEQYLILLQTNSPQPTVIKTTLEQIHRVCRPFFSRAHPADGAALFGSEAFSSRLIADVIMNRPRVTIASLLPKAAQAREPTPKAHSKAPSQSPTPPSILFSAFVLSLRRITKDASQWEEDEFVGQIQGHDPLGRPLILGSGSKRHLVEKWLQLVPRIPKQSPWHYELEHTGNQHLLYLPKIIRNAFGPHVTALPAKQKSEYYHILGLHLFSPAKSSSES